MPVSSVLNYSVFKFITFFFFNESFFGMCMKPLIMSFSIPSLECSRFSLRCNLKTEFRKTINTRGCGPTIKGVNKFSRQFLHSLEKAPNSWLLLSHLTLSCQELIFVYEADL